MTATQHAFAFGRISRDGRRLVVLPALTPPPIPGPWELRAITCATRPATVRPVASR
jgi:hypothetical protein